MHDSLILSKILKKWSSR